MINYYKKAWKVAGELNKFQYVRLTTILWILAVIDALYILATYNYAGFSSLGAMIANIIEAIIIAIVLCVLTYVNIRFFPWAKHVSKFEKSLLQDMEDSGNQAYQETIDEGPRDKMVIHEHPETSIVQDDAPRKDTTPTNVPYSEVQNVKAKYGSNYEIRRNTGGSTPVNVPETSNIQKNYGSNYAVVAKKPTDDEPTTREVSSVGYDISYVQESYKEFIRRAKTNKWLEAFRVFLTRMLLYPVLNTIINFILWPFSFLIGAYKMRSTVKAQNNE